MHRRFLADLSPFAQFPRYQDVADLADIAADPVRISSWRFPKYYRYVYSRRFPSVVSMLSLAALCLVFAGGCNRGVKPSQVGKKAPDFTVSDGTNSIHLGNYKGKVVLLNFWASWCGPCIQETPALVQLHHERPDLAILAVSVDEDPAAYQRFLNRFHVDLATVRDPNQTIAKMYGTDGWPETYIIDRKGVIRRKVVGDPDWSNPEIRTFLRGL